MRSTPFIGELRSYVKKEFSDILPSSGCLAFQVCDETWEGMFVDFREDGDITNKAVVNVMVEVPLRERTHLRYVCLCHKLAVYHFINFHSPQISDANVMDDCPATPTPVPVSVSSKGAARQLRLTSQLTLAQPLLEVGAPLCLGRGSNLMPRYALVL